MRRLITRFLLLLLSLARVHAVESAGYFNTNPPTNSDRANWTTGWDASDVTGWDYVGRVNGASGVYLGNDWVLTAGHVGAGAFALNGMTYPIVPNSATGIVKSGFNADLTLFRIASGPDLPSLEISSQGPIPFSSTQNGTSVMMIGYGGGQESWGLNTVGITYLPLRLGTYQTTDFETRYGTTTSGTSSITNNAWLISGDSGGGDFTYDSFSGKWMLAGINEAVDSAGNSYMVQLSQYAPQIQSYMGPMPVPEIPSITLLGLGMICLWAVRRVKNIHRHSKDLANYIHPVSERDAP